jgi:cellulose synthase/poly-beta-1,6-N-acetylglucosamine synthase-like glycosyltransferase
VPSRNKQLSAAQLLSGAQAGLAALVLIAIAAASMMVGAFRVLQAFVALLTAFYVCFVGFKLSLWAASGRASVHRGSSRRIDYRRLPRYTVLVPLCKEAAVVRPLVRALYSLRYPIERLQVLLLLEEYDSETLDAVRAIDLPHHFQVLVVPDVGPRTKPKACNFAYQYATGDMLVIYDAEDRPEPDQLLQAVAGFDAALARHPRIGCLQARLAFWNPRTAWISSFYWAEYVAHFQNTLVGLARLALIPPLGGTSNHFRMRALEAVAAANGMWDFEYPDGSPVTMRGPWDPYNVTEDADLAFRLALAGYDVGMLDSTTYEEAPDTPSKAKNQRSRWLQGYLQTALVHTRHPFRSIARVGPVRYLTFIMLMLGTPISLLINPLVWGATVLYIAARLYNLTTVLSFFERLFPAPVYYAAIAVAVAGNCALLCQKIITPLKRQQQSESALAGGQHPMADYLSRQEYGLSARFLLTPLWWAFTSVSAYRAFRKLLIPSQRSHWDKTPHGHALRTEAELAELSGVRSSDRRVSLARVSGDGIDRGSRRRGVDGGARRYDRPLDGVSAPPGSYAERHGARAGDAGPYDGQRPHVAENLG